MEENPPMNSPLERLADLVRQAEVKSRSSKLIDEIRQAAERLRAAERFFPAGQIQALVREIEDGEAHFGMLDARQQYAQLRIWIGRYRRIQASDQSAFSESDVELLQRTFPRLVGISKQYEPGYI